MDGERPFLDRCASRLEEAAVPPRLLWTDVQRRQIERAYEERWGEHWEEPTRFTVDWPPEASLWSAGHAYSRWLECPAHGTDYEDNCEHCNREEVEIEEAVWDWVVYVETEVDFGDGFEGPETSERFFFLRTEVDPREVRYVPGPADR